MKKWNKNIIFCYADRWRVLRVSGWIPSFGVPVANDSVKTPSTPETLSPEASAAVGQYPVSFYTFFQPFSFFFFSFLFSFISHFLYLYSTTMLYVRLQYLRRRKSILIQRETERMQCISIELTLDWNSCIQIKSNLFIRYHWKQLVTHHS